MTRCKTADMKPLTLAEVQAARIVAASTDCLCVQLDPGGGAAQLPDFELHNTEHNRIGVLEVTTTVRGDRAAFAAAQARYTISDQRLRLDWFLVTRTTGVSIRAEPPTDPGWFRPFGRVALGAGGHRVGQPG